MSRRASNPTLADFFHDMNQHGGATYSKVAEAHVIEVDTLPSPRGDAGERYQLTVWEAVEYSDGGGYAPPDGKEANRYAWDAVAREKYEDRESATVEAERLTADNLGGWIEAHPYGGPRSTYAERVGGA